ncbi:substrate-binding domain-containing protein [Thalassoglobus sp. JC818]|uniref:substrate-binding domain-containing protein n=1 Tax=Thalassoglobus sp. JC818 TaxID=3232136 RepID=UPI0034597596
MTINAICPISAPPPSNVRPDAEQVGYRAAEILDALINGNTFNGKPAPESVEFVVQKGVVERKSTQVIAAEDRELARVWHFIRQHACDGINVNDVADDRSLSRRQLERRFRAITPQWVAT